MVRTQIYLTEAEQRALKTMASQNGCGQSELIRQAVDQFIARTPAADRLSALRQARGIWQDRNDLPGFAALRDEFDRFDSPTG